MDEIKVLQTTHLAKFNQELNELVMQGYEIKAANAYFNIDRPVYFAVLRYKVAPLPSGKN